MSNWLSLLSLSPLPCPPCHRNIEVLFAGRICGGREVPDSTRWPNCRPINVGYSQGVRQLVHYHHWNRTGFKINVSNPHYLQVRLKLLCMLTLGWMFHHGASSVHQQ